MGKSGQTIGYHYMFSILFGIGRQVNEVREIRVADKTVWEDSVCNGDGEVKAIRKPEIFGGEKKEGGIQGPFRILFGDKDQILPGVGSADCGFGGPMSGFRICPDIKATIGGLVSEMRGTTMIWFDGLISSLNPYPKDWAFRVRRYSAGWYNNECWYPHKSVIFLGDGRIHSMNPAHMIYQCLTDPQWGRGLPPSLVDENSFIYAANRLCAEGFGLCIAWQRKEDVDQFIGIIQEYIDALVYPDPETGKMSIRLLRDDFVAADLPLFTPSSGLLAITEDESSSSDQIYNEMIGQGFDPITKTEFTVRVHNLAARQSQGAPNPQQRDMSAIATRDLMGRVLQRDLKKMCSGLKRFTVVLDRSGWKLRPGMPFKVSDPRRGISQVVLRAIEIEDQSFRDGKITIKCMEDVFGLPDTSYITVDDSSWTPPAVEAAPATEQGIYEANYRDIHRKGGQANVDALTPDDAMFGVVALSSNPTMYQFDLKSRAVGEPNYTTTTGSFTGAATLVDAITALQTTFEITGETGFAEELEGQAIVIGTEQMELVDYSPITQMLTVKRGVGDTVPRPHAASATVWTIDDDFVSDLRTYAAGESVEALALTRTAGDLLDAADATLMTLDLVGRHARPYPPAKVTVDGAEALTLGGVHAAPVIDWVHRDRLLQEDQLVGYLEGSVGPEAGTTYNLHVYAEDGTTLLSSHVGLTAGPFTYDATLQSADGDPVAVVIELESERDGLTSYQGQRFPIQLIGGYGYGYGYDYGGA